MAVGTGWNALIHFDERTDKMRLIYADYNPQTNSIDITTFENYILRIDKNVFRSSNISEVRMRC